MNDTFDFKRFGLLFKKTIFERPFQILGLTGIVLAFTLAVYSFLWYIGGRQPAQVLSFIWGFIGGGSFLASGVFGYFNSNASGSAYLTLPASAFEKWLCGVIIAGLFFCGIFFGFYRLMDTCFVTTYHNKLNPNSPLYKQLNDQVHIFSFEGNIVRQSVMMYLNFAGAMLVGSLYFNRVNFIKVALVIGGLLAFIYFFNLLVAYALFNNVTMAIPFNNVFIKTGNTEGVVNFPAAASKVAEIAVQYVIPCILWFTAYIRLREKEI